MALNLEPPMQQYDKAAEDRRNRALEIEDKRNLKSGQILDKLLFRDTADGTIKTVVVTGGALVVS